MVVNKCAPFCLLLSASDGHVLASDVLLFCRTRVEGTTQGQPGTCCNVFWIPCVKRVMGDYEAVIRTEEKRTWIGYSG